MLAGAQELQKQMRRQLEPSVLDGTLSSADLQKLLPSAEAVWHEPKHLPPKSQPKVSATGEVIPGWLVSLAKATQQELAISSGSDLPRTVSMRMQMHCFPCML